MLARQAARARRQRRLKLTATLVVGATAALAVTWLNQPGPDVSITADAASVGADPAAAPLEADQVSSTSLLQAALADLFPVADITVHESDESDALAAAFMVRDGYLISSGLALGDTP